MSNQEKLDPIDLLTCVYVVELYKAYKANPGNYYWPESALPQVASQMMIQVRKCKGGYSISPTLKNALKVFGVKPTYRAINKFVRSDIKRSDLDEEGKNFFDTLTSGAI